MDLSSFRRHLMTAIGISPVIVGATLAGCANGDALELDDELDVSATLDLDAIPSDDDGFAKPQGALPPPVTMGMSASSATAGQFLTLSITGAQPGETLHVFTSVRQGRACPPALNGGCIDLHAPRVLIQAPANARGNLTLRVMVPQASPAGTGIFFQAIGEAGPTASPVTRVVVDPLPEVCNASSYDLLTPESVFGGYEWLVCSQEPIGGCPSSLTQGEANWMFRQASQQNAGGFGYQVSQICHEDTYANQCCYVMDGYLVAIGRPLSTSDGPRAASMKPGSAWIGQVAVAPVSLTDDQRALVGARWLAQARDEHASVAAFARFALQLMALGAPPDLIAAATRAQGDEVRHAMACFGVASQVSGSEITAGKLDLAGVLDEGFDVASVLVGTIREGCVNETIAAAQARLAADTCEDASLRTMLLGIADDEGRHSTLAWATVRWILSEHPELRGLAEQTFAQAIVLPQPPPDAHHEVLRAHGVTPYDDLYELGQQVVAQVIAPCSAALLQTAAPPTIDA